MCRALALAVVLLLAVAVPATAAPMGAPRHFRVARPADGRARPGQLREWWGLHAVDPRSSRSLFLGVEREQGTIEVRALLAGPTSQRLYTSVYAARVRARPGFLDAGGSALDVAVHGRRVRIAGSQAPAGTLRLRGVRRGPAALGWRLGSAVRTLSGRRRPVTLNWSLLVATSTVHGTLLLPGGRRVNLNGWRASYERGWGNLLLADSQWSFWDEAVIHRGHGRAWVAYGLDRTDTATGPGARDAQWLGLLARVDGRHVRVCRPRIDRRGWVLGEWPTRMRLRCGGMHLRLRERQRLDATTRVGDGYEEVQGRPVVGHRLPGIVVHLAHISR